jgi:hypothetical protein
MVGVVGLVLPAVVTHVDIVCEIFGWRYFGTRPQSAAVGSLILGRYQVFQ